ncbi:glutamate synthase subunit beta [Heyndrickxia ginsengihumi]|uniref:glutamate synthase subunit beta n=1 Tax=Heyndrickxia ginsengihumi TaxID=363870 RepID=UPI003D1B2200
MRGTTDFIDKKREKPKELDPVKRIENWGEYQKPFPKEKLNTQASRCMECGTPFCQMGTLIGRQTSGCPLYNLIPEWNTLVYEGKWKEAYQRLLLTNNFPEFTSRACPAPCEGSCTAGLVSEPVTIKNIEKAIIDKAFDKGWVKPRIPLKRTGLKVAVVGSGPAGLTASDDLNQLGHSVTVFEKEDRFGGLLMYGIPNMKIEKKYVQRRVDLLQKEGIEFRANVEIGKDISLEDLQQEFDAVLLCIGAEKQRDMDIEGRHLHGIYPAMEYLKASTKHFLNNQSNTEPSISAKGKKVIVIGGGDTGADCVATAIRQGCKSVVQFGKHGELPKERTDDQPWPLNPSLFTLDYAYEESFKVFGEDPRKYYIQTTKFLGDDQNNVTGLETALFNESSSNQNQCWEADLVLIAIGFEGVQESYTTGIQTKNDRIETLPNKFQTNEENIFAAGDAKRGASLIVWAMQEGKKAAKEIDRYILRKAIESQQPSA